MVASLHRGGGALYSRAERPLFRRRGVESITAGAVLEALPQVGDANDEAGVGAVRARGQSLGPSPSVPSALGFGPRGAGASAVSESRERRDREPPPPGEAVRRPAVAGGGTVGAVLRVSAGHGGELRRAFLQGDAESLRHLPGVGLQRDRGVCAAGGGLRRRVAMGTAQAVGEEEALVDASSFENFAGCMAPLLRGVAALADVGCDLECYVTRVIGSTVQSAARSALAGVTVRQWERFEAELAATAGGARRHDAGGEFPLGAGAGEARAVDALRGGLQGATAGDFGTAAAAVAVAAAVPARAAGAGLRRDLGSGESGVSALVSGRGDEKGECDGIV